MIMEYIKNKIKNIDRETKLDIIEMSRVYVGAILLMILMWTGTVCGIYAGECMEVNLSELDSYEDILYIVVGNSTNIEGMNITFNNQTQNVTICFAVNYAPDSFTLVFLNNQTNEVIKETIVYRGGGGGSVRYVDKIINQNQTVYVPEYIDREIEIEKIIDNTTVLETGYELWHVLLAMALGGVFCWYIMRPKKEGEDKEEDIEKEYE